MSTDAKPGGNGLPIELQIIELFTVANVLELGPTDVQKLLGVSKGTASPRMKVLAEHGYLLARGDGRYVLGAKLGAAWAAYLSRLGEQVNAAQLIVNSAFEPLQAVLQLMRGGSRPGGEA